MPVNADSSLTSICTVYRLSSLLSRWIVWASFSSYSGKQGSAQIKNAEFTHPQQRRGATRACWDWQPLYVHREFTSSISTPDIVYLNVINQHGSETLLCLGCPRVYTPEYTTLTSTPPTLVSCNYHIEELEESFSDKFPSQQHRTGQKGQQKCSYNKYCLK